MGDGRGVYAALRPLLFSMPPALAHACALWALAPFENSGELRGVLGRALGVPSDPRLAIERLGLRFASPVGLAAGFDKNARRPRALAALGFGHLEIGTVTARPQSANPSPNLFRLPADRALINRLGFPNDGAATVAARLRGVRSRLGVPIAISIGKSRSVRPDAIDEVIADYVAALDAVHDVADFVVANVSSPNTQGLRSLQARDQALALFGSLRRRTAGRLLVKIAPDLDDAQLEDILAVVEAVGLDGVVASNTTLMREGLRTDPALIRAVGAGGLSGPPLRARAVSRVRAIRERLGPRSFVIGVGGVEKAQDAFDLIGAGADLVQLYTGFVYEGPGAPARIARGLLDRLDRSGLRSLDELRAP